MLLIRKGGFCTMYHTIDIMKLQEEVRKKQNKKRFQHTLGVLYTSACLGMKYNYDIRKAELAGLFHDYAKCMSDEELLRKCTKYNISISSFEEKMPYLLHGKLSAYYVKNRFNIDDLDILNSIIYHTTGRPDMGTLEKIVFVADYIEPNRKIIPNLELIRNTAFLDLDKTVYLILKNVLDYLKRNPENIIDPNTIETYEFYKKSSS